MIHAVIVPESHEYDSHLKYFHGKIGHNIGLAHSNENGAEYTDQTGMMGYSYGSSDTPRR